MLRTIGHLNQVDDVEFIPNEELTVEDVLDACREILAMLHQLQKVYLCNKDVQEFCFVSTDLVKTIAEMAQIKQEVNDENVEMLEEIGTYCRAYTFDGMEFRTGGIV